MSDNETPDSSPPDAAEPHPTSGGAETPAGLGTGPIEPPAEEPATSAPPETTVPAGSAPSRRYWFSGRAAMLAAAAALAVGGGTVGFAIGHVTADGGGGTGTVSDRRPDWDGDGGFRQHGPLGVPPEHDDRSGYQNRAGDDGAVT